MSVGEKIRSLFRMELQVRLAVDFGSYPDPDPDPDTPYMYHCHLLYHEDSGMMGQFVIVEPGTESQVSKELSNGSHDH